MATSAIPQLEQVQVDGVCEVCTSLSQSRVDSCCAVASSVACFEKFAAVGAQKTPAITAASTTPAANTATATGGGSIPAATTRSSGSNKVDVVDIARPILAMLGRVGWALL